VNAENFKDNADLSAATCRVSFTVQAERQALDEEKNSERVRWSLPYFKKLHFMFHRNKK
jgi:hypothetical protein